jgi:hypothetical protein
LSPEIVYFYTEEDQPDGMSTRDWHIKGARCVAFPICRLILTVPSGLLVKIHPTMLDIFCGM